MNQFAPALAPHAIDTAASAFASDGHVRIEPVLDPRAAAGLGAFLADAAPWRRVMNQDEKTWDLDIGELQGLSGTQAEQMMKIIHDQACHGFQFLFDSVRVSEDPAERTARGLPIDGLVSAFNTPQWLDLFRRLTGVAEIAMVDGQATRYLPGHFLTAHDDDVDGKNRVAAYVLNLTPEWRTEWGGLLQFHDGEGDVIRALKPRFNALHLLKVPQVHSVSHVAPFAGGPRLSITGWLRR